MADDLPGYSSGPPSYAPTGTGSSDASEPLVHPSSSFSRARQVSDAPPPSRVSLLASQYEAIDNPPSAPHRSYNPSNYQPYDSSAPATTSPTPSLSQRSRGPYIPFTPPRGSGHRSYSPAPQIDRTWAPPSSVNTSTDWDSAHSGTASGRLYDNRPDTPSSVHTRTSIVSRSSRPLPPNPPTFSYGAGGMGERRYDVPGEYEGGGIAEEEMDAKLRLDEEEMYDRDYMEHLDPDDDLDDIDDEGDHRNPRNSRHFEHHRGPDLDEESITDDLDSRFDHHVVPITVGLGPTDSLSGLTLHQTLSGGDLSTFASLHSKTPLSSSTPAPGDDVSAAGEHYGPAPKNAQARRGLHHKAIMKKKQVKLTRGELILDCRIPSILYSFLPRKNDMEFTHMRYTAVTSDPDQFTERGYMLRQNLDTTARETELFICVTMYNEDEVHFTRTMHGIMRNVAHFCSRTKSRVWGKDGWQKIVVCIVSDGRKKVHPRVLDALAAMGVYQDGIAKNLVNGRQVTAHVYEYTTQVSLDSDMKFKGAEKGIVPVQMLFCLKEQNAKKLNSHRWFFNAFGRALNPNVCIMLDVGTRPGPTSLYHLWKAFDTDSNVGGACGEIKAMKGKGWVGLFNPLVASQNFEYKMSNILDKPLESVFGYITVLPGALSAYRYHALQNDENGHGPLSQYFKGEKLHGKDADIFTANMYLAEDRILCWELVAKRNERWVLKYVRSATGETDVPDAVPEFVSQRRRWLNGALFAAIFSLIHFRQIWTTDHTLIRKVLLHVEFFYQFISLLFTYFSLANFYLTFYFISGALSEPLLDPFGGGWGARIFTLLKLFIILLISTQFILSMGNRPQGAKRMFMATMASYAVIMMYTTFASLYIVIKALTRTSPVVATDASIGNNVFTNLIISTASTLGIYFLMSFLYLDPWHMITSSAQYFLMLPSYIVTLQVYAFCNTHDVSWGTKGDNTINTDLGAAISGTKGNDEMVELEMPSGQLDIDSGYDEALRNLRDRLEVPQEPPSVTQEHEDYYRAVRTYMVVVWMVANGVLAMGITEAFPVTEVRGNWYLTFLLWAVAAVAFFRALGSGAYLVIEMMYGLVEGKFRIDISRIKDRFEPPWKRIQKVNAKANEKAAMQGP